MKPTCHQTLIWIVSICMVACGPDQQAPEQPEDPPKPVELRAFLDKAVATTGDELTYTIEIDRDKDISVDLPEPGAEIAGLRIVDSHTQSPETNADRVIERRIYKLRADLVGSYVLPEVQATYLPLTPNDQKQPPDPVTLSTSRIFLEVKSVLPKDGSAQDVRDLKPLRKADVGVDIYTWITAAAAIAILGLGLFFWIRRKRKQTASIPETPPHQLAIEALDALRNTDFDDPESIRRFYFLISEIVRQYTEKRFGLNATDLTTNEILARAASLSELSERQRGLLKDFLTHTDMVKFADLNPNETQIQACFDQAVQYVESTIPETPQTGDQSNRRAA